MASYEPVFSHLFGIQPWDADAHMTYDQYRRYKAFADAWLKAQREAGGA